MPSRICILVVASLCALGQPQAATPEEFDDYLIVEAAGAAAETVAVCVRFQRQWPRSAMLPAVLERRFLALQQLGRPAEAVVVAREALRLAPDNLTVRAALAVQLASEVPGEALAEAAKVAEGLESLRMARSVPLARVRETRARLGAQAHTAAGVAHYQMGDTAGALRELEAAEALLPEPALLLRLGRLYAAAGRRHEARARFEKVAGSGFEPLAEMARSELRALLK